MLWSILSLSIALWIGVPVVTSQNCQSDLSRNILNILNNPQYDRATWGIEIVGIPSSPSLSPTSLPPSSSSSSSLFSLIPRNFRVPASNNKLLTTSALYFSYLDDVTVLLPRRNPFLFCFWFLVILLFLCSHFHWIRCFGVLSILSILQTTRFVTPFLVKDTEKGQRDYSFAFFTNISSSSLKHPHLSQ